MRWKTSRRSKNVEDRRGRRGGGGFRFPFPMGGGRGSGLGIGGGTLLLLALGFVLLGGDPLSLLRMFTGGGPVVIGPSAPHTRQIPQPVPRSTPAGGAPGSKAGDEQAEFVSAVLASTEDVWSSIFKKYGAVYTPPKLVMFTGYVQSACGMTSAAAGPFYCPGDHKVYIDLSFYRQLQAMGGSGDFARAYVLGHEVGHHIQNLAGTSDKVRRKQMMASKATANALSVLMELQADCYAGIWAHYANQQQKMLEPGDIEEGLRAAKSIGDDAIMRNAGARVRPDAFTHGSSKQRMEWLKRGLATGALESCDTFTKAGVKL